MARGIGLLWVIDPIFYINEFFGKWCKNFEKSVPLQAEEGHCRMISC